MAEPPLVVGITGASGAAYAVRLLEVLLAAGREVHLAISPSGQAVIETELGRRIDTVVDGKDFDTFATSALALLATAVTPQLTAAAAIAKFVSRAIPQVLVRNRDDQVGLYYLSLNRMEHYPNGERKRDDVPDLSNNVRVDYSIFGTTYTV